MTRRALLAGLLLLAGSGCVRMVEPEALDPVTGATALVRTELLFGRLRPDGTVVSDAEWQAFVADHVTPRFPNGFTVLDATGQFRDRAGRVLTEPTKILLVVHGPDARTRALLQELRDVYRRLFQQESVLLITGPAQVGF